MQVRLDEDAPSSGQGRAHEGSAPPPEQVKTSPAPPHTSPPAKVMRTSHADPSATRCQASIGNQPSRSARPCWPPGTSRHHPNHPLTAHSSLWVSFQGCSSSLIGGQHRADLVVGEDPHAVTVGRPRATGEGGHQMPLRSPAAGTSRQRPTRAGTSSCPCRGGSVPPRDEAGRSVVVVGDEQVMARLIKEPASRVGAEQDGRGMRWPTRLRVLARTKTFDEVRAGPVAGDHRVDRPAE